MDKANTKKSMAMAVAIPNASTQYAIPKPKPKSKPSSTTTLLHVLFVWPLPHLSSFVPQFSPFLRHVVRAFCVVRVFVAPCFSPAPLRSSLTRSLCLPVVSRSTPAVHAFKWHWHFVWCNVVLFCGARNQTSVVVRVDHLWCVNK